MKRIISVALAVVMVLSTCLMVGCGSSKTPIANNNTPVNDPDAFDPDSVIVNTGTETGIKLMSAAATDNEIALLGLTNEPSKSVTISASGTPVEAMQQGVRWEVSWKNPSSSWASGKNVSDYITYTSTTYSITIALQSEFGEQIIVKALSLDTPGLSATCTIDYAQRVTGISLNIGNIPCVMDGGKTNITYEICPTETGDGGAVTYTVHKSSVYTIEDTFSETITIDYVNPGSNPSKLEFGSGNMLFGTYVDNNVSQSIKGKSIYFDYKNEMMNWVHVDVGSGEYAFNEISTLEIANILSKVSNKNIGCIYVKLKGTYSTFNDTTILYFDGYRNSTKLNQINLDLQNYIF